MAKDNVLFQDTLQRILNNQVIETLDLSNQELTSADASQLATALRSSTSISRVLLTNNNIGAEGSIAIVDAFKANSRLAWLYLNKNPIGADGFQAVVNIVSQNFQISLLAIDSLALGDAGAQKIATALLSNTRLGVLAMNDNGIGDSGAIALADAIQAHPVLNHLQLNYNVIGDSGTIAIANLSLSTLLLGGNQFTHVGIQAIADNLSSPNSQLGDLRLGDMPSIGDAGVKVIVGALKNNVKLQTLFLPGVGMTSASVPGLASLFAVNSNLRYYWFANNNINNNGAQTFIDALQTYYPLQLLRLDGNSIGARYLTQINALIQRNVDNAFAIQSVMNQIKNNQINDIDFSALHISDADIPTLISSLSNRGAPYTLNLSNGLISANGATILADFLSNDKYMVSLDLRNNKVGSVGAQALAASLESNASLQRLYLLQNTIGDDGAIALAEMLKINTKLTYLNIDSNSIGANGAIALATALRINTQLTVLHLFMNSIGDDGASAFASALRENTILTLLGLSTNGISSVGATALASALQANIALKSLDLGANAIGSSGATALALALRVNTHLKVLFVHSNSIGDTGAIAFANMLQVNARLVTLYLYNNSIGSSGAQALADALKVNIDLQILWLYGNALGEVGASALASALQFNYVLTTLLRDASNFDTQINVYLTRNQQYPIFTANQISVAQAVPGSCSIVLTSSDIQVMDYNNIPRTFTFNVTEVENGFFSPSNQFTQIELNNGTVRFIYDGVGTPAYNITASNGDFTTPNPRRGAVSFMPYLATTTRPFTATPLAITSAASTVSAMSCVPEVTSSTTLEPVATSSTLSTAPENSGGGGSKSFNLGVIIGGTAAAVAALSLGFFAWKRHRRNTQPRAATELPQYEGGTPLTQAAKTSSNLTRNPCYEAGDPLVYSEIPGDNYITVEDATTPVSHHTANPLYQTAEQPARSRQADPRHLYELPDIPGAVGSSSSTDDALPSEFGFGRT